MPVKATFLHHQILNNPHSSNHENLACKTGFVTDHQKEFLRDFFYIYIFEFFRHMRLWYHHILSCSLQVNDLPATCWCGWCVAQSYSEIEKKKVSGVYYLCTSSRLVYVNAGTHIFPSFPFFSSPLYSILCVSLTLLPCVLTEHWAVEGVVLYTLLWWPKNYCFHYPFCVSDLSLIEEFPFLRKVLYDKLSSAEPTCVEN